MGVSKTSGSSSSFKKSQAVVEVSKTPGKLHFSKSCFKPLVKPLVRVKTP